MDIDVHILRVDGNKKGDQRKTSHHDQGLVSPLDGRIQRLFLDPASVDKIVHFLAVGAGQAYR